MESHSLPKLVIPSSLTQKPFLGERFDSKMEKSGLLPIQGPGGADGVILKSTDGGQSFVELTRGTIPTGSGGDAGISYNPKTKQWLQLLGERMN
jgi:hypothetical protein